jgi:Ran GTPase-activating protein (RanGAP) involved in mRNA processing and transport
MIRVAYGNAPELESMSFDNEYNKDEIVEYLKEIYDDIEEITKKEFTQYLGDSEFDDEVEEFEDKREFYPDIEDEEDED